ncbi:MAG: hypothetical protein R3301_18560, partial [Saprospiraceae bacterium]|nr:hypothetical protein [Saprospiraceae bacterium]
MSDQFQSKMRALLEKLQEESWQLELLISGFAIFLVAAVREPIQDFATQAQVTMIGIPDSSLLSVSIGVMLGSWFFLLANLILHVVLRGFWISAIGVRYVSGDIDFDRLRLAPRFDRYLRRRIPSFDDFIARLEKVCSVVFAFTFLIIFILIACGMFVVLIAVVDKLLEALLEPHVSAGFFDTV